MPVLSFGRRRFVVVRSITFALAVMVLVVFPIAAFILVAVTQSFGEVVIASVILFTPCIGFLLLSRAICVVSSGYVRPVRPGSRRVGVEELESLSVDVSRESVVATLVDRSTVALLSYTLQAAGSEENLTRVLTEAQESIEQEIQT